MRNMSRGRATLHPLASTLMPALEGPHASADAGLPSVEACSRNCNVAAAHEDTDGAGTICALNRERDRNAR